MAHQELNGHRPDMGQRYAEGEAGPQARPRFNSEVAAKSQRFRPHGGHADAASGRVGGHFAAGQPVKED